MSPARPPARERPDAQGAGAVPDVRDPRELRGAFGTFATGITVVTVGGALPRGMTANSFTAVSLDPPLVLVCVGREAVMHQVLLNAEHFAVSVLAADHREVARHFADRSRPLGSGQFAVGDWRPGTVTGAPLLTGALAHFECAGRARYDGGDHTVFLGEVLALSRAPAGEALLFAGGRFRNLAPEHAEAAA
ncbi:flavin reductase family protein [Streptomyces clavuligerus]|uniref:Flavin reductase domain protein n=1 Tax=Streptomyces clavuligerus TaxID=1901 RepID=B5H1E3_STRCL|nr:flavin reductase family protein [Streptomyces clavuligerus]EDY52389.1 monooxygenase [Streptomyces clavuligerus]EFG04836.1 Flavin reductase domain protein [Streptomyces clavuligerus]MBY6306718.1 flavin reductase family protein [Streptomyces clavuligerus]QCS10674.1 flavin reductase [Streptomyces clavuligerus]QPJ97289.1 flavin reductase [Streptomyces clavuligerus]